MTSFTNGVELIDPRCLLGKHEKAAPAIGCRPFAFLHIGTICLEVRIRSAALIFLARHKTAILGATLLAGVVRQLRGTGCQPVHSRIVAVGWQVPTCGVGVDRSSSVLEKSRRTRRPAPRAMPGAAAIQLWRGSTPLIYQGQKTSKCGGISPNFFQIFFHVFQSGFYRLPDGTFVHAFFQSNLTIAPAEDHTGVHTAALRFG